MAYRVCWAVHHEKFTPLADRGVSHGEKTQASVKGSHWLAPSLREEADVLWLDKSGI